MHAGCVFVVLFLVCVQTMEASVRYVVGDLGVDVNTNGKVTVGMVAPDNLFFDPTDDTYHVTSEVRKLSLFDSAGVLVKEHAFYQNAGSFESKNGAVHELDGAAVDGRRMTPTGALRRDFGENVMHFNEYVFAKEGTTSVGDQSVNVTLYDTKVEMILGTLEDTEHCPQCKSRVKRMQLDFRFTSSGESRMAVKNGFTKVQKDGGVQILLPSSIIVDGVAQTSEGNPEIQIDGDHVDVTLQIPAFNTSTTYHALIIPSKTPVPAVSPTAGKEEEEEEEEIENEVEYSFSTKPADTGEEVFVRAGTDDDDDNDDENKIEENKIEERADDDQETAKASGPNGLDSDNPNKATESIPGMFALLFSVLICVLAGH